MDGGEQIQQPKVLFETIDSDIDGCGGNMVSARCFIKHLQFEKRRADRSKSPLSIAIFHVEGSVDDQLRDRERLVPILRESKRSTDILGQLGTGTIAVLLLDTGEDGTQTFVRKVRGKTGGISLSTATGTYPDQIFESIKAGNEGLPDLGEIWIEENQDPRGFERLLKRAFDLTAATIGLILLAPVMLGTALAVALTSPGPVIFKQVRLGKRGVPFVLYKFRSMVCDADDTIHREYVTDLIRRSQQGDGARDSGKVWVKLGLDPRVTPVGRIIRKTSLDELPQLFNVVKGDLSLVGPRPPLPYEAEQYQAWHLRRVLEMKPGITGLWQVDGANGCTFDEMVRMDLRYLRQWSLLLDFKLICRTIGVVLHRKGAH